MLVGFAALRLDNKKYLGEWIKRIEDDLMKMNKENLFKLAMSCVIYVRQFEAFYLEVHKSCAA